MADPQLYPGTTIAKLLNITERRLQQLAQEGVVPKSERGRYPLVGAVQGYVKYLQDRAIGKDVSSGDALQHRARLLVAQADIAEMDASQRRGELVNAEGVQRFWTDRIASCRTRLLLLAQTIAAIAPPDIRATMRTNVQKIVNEALSDLANDEPDDTTGDDVESRPPDLEPAA